MGSETKEGLIEVANTQPTMMLWFNQYLRRRHGIAITAYGEEPDGETKIFVHEKQPATLRRCKHDSQLLAGENHGVGPYVEKGDCGLDVGVLGTGFPALRRP